MLRRRARAPARKPKSPPCPLPAKVTRQIMEFIHGIRRTIQPTTSLRSQVKVRLIHYLLLTIPAMPHIPLRAFISMVSFLETLTVIAPRIRRRAISNSNRTCFHQREDREQYSPSGIDSELAMVILQPTWPAHP